jgi:transcriptional regulator with XRE-family HTH domain
MNRTNDGLKAARKRKDLTQEVLGERSKVPQETLSRLERLGPSRAVINAMRVAKALGTSVEALFGSYL